MDHEALIHLDCRAGNAGPCQLSSLQPFVEAAGLTDREVEDRVASVRVLTS